MKIYVVSAIGTGRTLLSAFDSALKESGVYNYNLIPLSSVIPPQTKVIRSRSYESPEEEHGHKLYVVKAEMRSNEAGKYIAAGIGWYQWGDKKGVFVEHEIIGETRVAVESEIQARIINSLHDLCDFRNIKFDEKKVKSAKVVTQVKNRPACALVLAVYKAEGWE